MAGRSQAQRILCLLHSAWPEWTPAPVLSQISLQYGARIHSLRKKGWQIANKVEVRDGVKHGYFRLATPGSPPNPKPRHSSTELKDKTTVAPALPATGSGLLFTLPERIHPYPD